MNQAVQEYVAMIPEFGVPLPPPSKYMDLRERAMAACNTVNLLQAHGLKVDPPDESDFDDISVIVAAYAKDEEATSKGVTAANFASLPTATVLAVNNILQEFGHLVAESAADVRHLVVNKLILESENKDPRIRMRALELLGKVSDVGLFVERKEVTVNYTNSDALRERLRDKLITLRRGVDGTYAATPDPTQLASVDQAHTPTGDSITEDAEYTDAQI